jgi:hypothetical protein
MVAAITGIITGAGTDMVTGIDSRGRKPVGINFGAGMEVPVLSSFSRASVSGALSKVRAVSWLTGQASQSEA